MQSGLKLGPGRFGDPLSWDESGPIIYMYHEPPPRIPRFSVRDNHVSAARQDAGCHFQNGKCQRFITFLGEFGRCDSNGSLVVLLSIEHPDTDPSTDLKQACILNQCGGRISFLGTSVSLPLSSDVVIRIHRPPFRDYPRPRGKGSLTATRV